MKPTSLYPNLAHEVLFIKYSMFFYAYVLKHMNVMTLEAICWKEQNHTLEAAWVTETPHRKPPTKYQNWTPTCEKLIYIGFSHSNVDICLF